MYIKKKCWNKKKRRRNFWRRKITLNSEVTIERIQTQSKENIYILEEQKMIMYIYIKKNKKNTQDLEKRRKRKRKNRAKWHRLTFPVISLALAFSFKYWYSIGCEWVEEENERKKNENVKKNILVKQNGERLVW